METMLPMDTEKFSTGATLPHKRLFFDEFFHSNLLDGL